VVGKGIFRPHTLPQTIVIASVVMSCMPADILYAGATHLACCTAGVLRPIDTGRLLEVVGHLYELWVDTIAAALPADEALDRGVVHPAPCSGRCPPRGITSNPSREHAPPLQTHRELTPPPQVCRELTPPPQVCREQAHTGYAVDQVRVQPGGTLDGLLRSLARSVDTAQAGVMAHARRQLVDSLDHGPEVDVGGHSVPLGILFPPPVTQISSVTTRLDISTAHASDGSVETVLPGPHRPSNASLEVRFDCAPLLGEAGTQDVPTDAK
jgi:hypothetical protein